MGAWGHGVFDNDTACDWAYDLKERDDLSYVEETLDKVLAVGNDYLESPDAEEALAAAEVIARLQGNWGARDSYTESMDTWVESVGLRPSRELARKAQSAIDRVLTAPSELLELWGEGKDLELWKQTLADLKSRIHV